MFDYGIDKGSVKRVNMNKKGESKHFWGFRKMFRDWLTKLNVVFFDACCPESSEENIFPVRYNASTQELEYFNGTSWVEITNIQNTTTTTSTTTTTTAP